MIKNPLLHRYWVTFDPSDERARRAALGYGVTAFTIKDALSLVSSEAFPGEPLPPVDRVVEDVDISTLDPRHVLANAGDPVRRGIWYPNLGPPADRR
jgi:hypothetical protein